MVPVDSFRGFFEAVPCSLSSKSDAFLPISAFANVFAGAHSSGTDFCLLTARSVAGDDAWDACLHSFAFTERAWAEAAGSCFGFPPR